MPDTSVWLTAAVATTHRADLRRSRRRTALPAAALRRARRTRRAAAR